MAIYDLPRSFSLDPLPDRHFRLSMNIVHGGQPRTIEYDWSCTQEKVFSENSGWTLSWQAPRRKFVVREIANDMVVFFRQPSSAYCRLEGETQYTADIGVIPDPSSIDNLIVYHVRQFPRSSAVRGGNIKRLNPDARVEGPSLKERYLEARISALEDELISSAVFITPESLWTAYPKLNEFFSSISTLTVAPRPTHPHQPVGFPIWRESSLKLDDVHKRTYYVVQDIEGTMRFDPSAVAQNWLVFRRGSPDFFRRATTFCYGERCVSLTTGNYNEIYDPQTRNIVGVFQSTLRSELQ